MGIEEGSPATPSWFCRRKLSRGVKTVRIKPERRLGETHRLASTLERTSDEIKSKWTRCGHQRPQHAAMAVRLDPTSASCIA